MWMRTVAPILLALFVNVSALPAAADELDQAARASNQSVMAFLAEHGVTSRAMSAPQLAACKEEGAQCSADADCCRGVCKHAGDAGHICVAK